MYSDSLQRLPVDQWSKLKVLFKKDWPRSISGFAALDTVEDLIDLGYRDIFKVYCPYGDLENGMFAINIKGNLMEYIIQCPKDDTSKLEEALKSTKIIDWSIFFESPFTPKHIIELLYKIAKEKNLKTRRIVPSYTFVRNNNTPYEVKLPLGFTFENLNLEHIQIVDSFWPYRYPTSEIHFEQLIKAKLGYGLFDNKDLVAWVFINEVGGLGHLYTLEKHRRKGYGALVVKLISNILLEKGKTVFAFCTKGNVAAEKMYVKLGFDRVQDVEWIEFEKNTGTSVANKL